jgi:membrane protease YdiL (CAAX protease family)
VSARNLTGQRRRVSLAGTAALVMIGGGALIWRVHLTVMPSRDRALALAALYGAILLASLLAPAPPGTRHLSPAVVLLAGLAGVGVAAWTAGTPMPLPIGVQTALLSVLAAVAEEALFRRAAYAALEPYGVPMAIGVTALLFGLMHIPLYGVAAFPVDLGAGLLFGWQRWASGTWTVPAATHAAANLLAVIAR